MVTGAILAGGKSRRMGVNKAFLRLGNRTLIEHGIHRIQPIADELLIITNTPDEYKHLGIETKADIIPNSGTLGGIHSALTHATNDAVICVGCDNPFIDTNLLLYLISVLGKHDAVIPYTCSEKGQMTLQTLCAVYSKRCLPIIKKMLNDAEYRVHALKWHAKINLITPETWKKIDPDGYSFLNINTPDDFEVAQTIFDSL
ncbi:molybdenum cofactor guanylyltransferase [Candidatus Poribacteria bacterium]|nr:molybdenum cofactor guanylyltransferase [Candidatus Poribacteria bacterium]MYB65363.1 molybdenum cofactor guanylyltransferase [Candidatus Poribacteria bacterium]MYF54538.1 molybdenum cofactor guanylyltransferase [Candidatus Poribacteria bacterium]MYI94673.1 molybdenum cofactor guanylyltransferase [Candidatus Poribacteria bacterium]